MKHEICTHLYLGTLMLYWAWEGYSMQIKVALFLDNIHIPLMPFCPTLFFYTLTIQYVNTAVDVNDRVI